MKQSEQTNLEQHITVVGWLHIISSLLFLVIAAFIFLLFVGIGVAVATEDPMALRVLGAVGTTVGVFLSVMALPGLAAGYGLLKRYSWARPLALVVGFLNLLNFPFGTAIGAYTIWVLLQQNAPDYFVALKTA